MQDYIQVNKSLWNKKTAIHIGSDFYDNENFIKGKTSLKEIELGLLGDVKGKKILHLQCHFGQDTLSLARMGAQVTGVDLSDAAIQQAERLAIQLNLTQQTQFICCDVNELDNHLTEQFDIVFTSYGTIGWLPKIDKWGALIAHFLKPKGQFIFVEFHPVLWMLDDAFEQLAYPYFNKKIFHEAYTTSYTDGAAHEAIMGYSWNHPLSAVLSTLLKNQLVLENFQEYDYSPYACFPNTVEIEEGYQIKGLEGKLPMVYSIVARKE
ncbi:MAG: class I SAM-dependent methyltransferase [Saprospiraceae bacterium]